MSYYDEAALEARAVSAADVETRATFITRTYTHLMGAICAFIGLEIAIFQSGIAERISISMMDKWWLVLGAFMLVSWLASHTAHSAKSLAVQYSALAAFVALEAAIFVPILYIAQLRAPGAIESAAYVTGGGFLGLTAIAFITRKDFSFLGGILRWIAFCAIGAIVISLFTDFQLGAWFSIGMIVFAGAAILYNTSNIIHHYPEDRYVAASLELFASVALLLWYVLRLFMGNRD